MKQTILRPIRIVFAIFLLLATSLLFIDFRERIPLDYFNFVLFPQFYPSLLKFIHAVSWVSAGFIVITLLTLFFGRVYCSFICPLGILQDIISRVSRKLGFIKKFKYSKPFTVLRYTVLAAAVVFLLFDFAMLVTILEPYSNFGRIMNGLLLPLFTGANNLIASVLRGMEIYSVSPVHVHSNFIGVTFPLIVLATLLWLAGRRGRLYCNTICPVGSLLGLISKVSVFKLVINEELCTSCGKCAVSCKAECISIKDKKVDMSRCVGCMNCINSCEQREIKYRLALVPAKRAADTKKRTFIKESLGAMLFFIGISQSMKASSKERARNRHRQGSSRPTTISYKKNYVVSPPGSVSHEHFNHDCTGCHLCVANCPTDVLQPSMLQYGLKGFLQPYMDYETSYCNFYCTRCSEVCPTGAILPLSLEEKKTLQIGTVQFIIGNCVVYTENTACGSCAEHCPTAAVFMVPYKNGLTIPETNVDICIGCGACEYACPMEPFKAIYVDGLALHRQAQRPKIKALDVELTDDFPF